MAKTAPSAIDPTPWATADYTHIFDTSLSVTCAFGLVGSGLPAWNLRLVIDETASPTGILTGETTPAAQVVLKNYIYNAQYHVWVTAGYADRAQQTLFRGVLMSVELGSDGLARFEAHSAEVLYDTFPNNTATYTVGASDTSVGDVESALQGGGYGYTYVPLNRHATIGTLATPSSYTAFRQQSLQSTDSVLDFLISCANSIGQWLRGDQRGRTNYAGSWYDYSRMILSDRWDSGTPINLTPITTKWTNRQSADDYADLLQITARYKSGGSEATKTARYGSFISGPPRGKSIDINYRPGTAFTSGTDPVAQAWANSYAARTWKLTADCRAVWWLEPGHRATINDTTGTVTRIEFQIDKGTMTITLRPTTTWTPA